jgi:hypothetical protein
MMNEALQLSAIELRYALTMELFSHGGHNAASLAAETDVTNVTSCR